MKYFIILLFTTLQITPSFSIDYKKTENVILESDRLGYEDYNSYYDDFYRLTKDGSDQKGALWIKESIDLSAPFVIEFLADFGADEIGADGIALVFHKDPRVMNNADNLVNVIGHSGARIGYGSAPGKLPVQNSIALEFDTYYNLPLISDLPNGNDHFDIIRNGDILNSTIPIVDLTQIESEGYKKVQVVWLPNQQQNNIGTLTVIYECTVIFQNNNFQIDLNLNWNNTLDDVYVGLTAATGDHVNYHRVLLRLPELELKSEPLCGNVQLNASFPEFCNTYKYEWTAADGSTDGLINPNTINPIAYKSGTYTCKVTEVNSSYTWSAHIDAILDEDISVGVGVPNYSYVKRYNNRYYIDNNLESIDDGICGTLTSHDCGFLITATSRFHFISGNYNGVGLWLLKTNYLGDLEFSKYYISSSGVDLASVTELERKQNYRLKTVLHKSINDYQLVDNIGNDCSLPISDEILPRKKHTGYFLVGETSKLYSEESSHGLPYQSIDMLFIKVDKNGELIKDIAFDYSGGYDKVIDVHQLMNDKYIALNEHRLNNNDIDGSVLGSCFTGGVGGNTFTLLNSFGFKNLGNKMTFDNSHLISFPTNQNEIIKNEYLHLLATPIELPNNQIEIGIAKLNNTLTSTFNNYSNKQIKISSDNSLISNELRILRSDKNPNFFYVVKGDWIAKFDLDLNLISSVKIIPPQNYEIKSLFDAVYINDQTSDKIELILSINNSSLDRWQAILSYDINNNSITAKKFTYGGNTFDNLNSLEGGLFFSNSKQGTNYEFDVIASYYNYDFPGCFEDKTFTIENKNVQVSNSNFMEVVDIAFSTYDPQIVSLNHYPEEVATECVDVNSCECEDIDESSLEIYTVAKPRHFDNSDCCFDVYLKNTGDCKLVGYEFSITQSEYGQETDLPLTKTLPFLQVNTSQKLGEICLADGVDEVEISVSLRKSGETEFCKDENFDPLVFKTSVTCFEGCCDYIKVNFLPADPEGSNCCWLPNIISTNPLCDVNDVVIEYYDLQSNRINLNNEGELCVDPSVDEISFNVRIGDEVCSTIRTRKLECDECDCPDDFIKSTWLKVEANKDSPLCPAGQCAVTVELDITPEYLSCFTHYNLLYVVLDKDGNEIQSSDFMLNQASIPTNGILTGVPQCINEGESIVVRVRLYSNGTTDSYCELNSPEVFCNKITNIHRIEPCDVDNPTEAWSIEQSVRIFLDGCEYIVTYVYRLTSDGFQDVQLTGYLKVDDDCVTTKTREDVLKSALPNAIADILSIETDWEPKNESSNNCSNIWRVVQNSCWVTFYGVDEEGEFSITERCISDCCARQLRVCIDENNKVTVEDIGFAKGSSTFNCSVQPVPVVDNPNDYTSNSGCQDLNCDIYIDLEGVADQPYDSRKEIIDILTDPNIKRVKDRIFNNNSLLLYQLFYNSEFFRITVQETNFESIDIEIYNLNGQLIKSKNYNNVINGSIVEASLNELSSGTYIVNIICGNGIFANHTIQLLK